MPGFLGSAASFRADLNLIVQIVLGLAVLAGAYLARIKRYRAHGICMSSVLLLNLVAIAGVMWPSFDTQVLPRLAGHLHKRYYEVAAVHGVLGGAAESLGIYILLVAATDVVPEALRIRRWKIWMRVELVLWMAVLASGIGTYIFWYNPVWRK
jgi:uncharacterized membrane protein YozB (DUF420 family)